MAEPKSILFATCYLDASGVTGINCHVLRACRDAGFRVHVVTTDTLPADSSDWTFKFEEFSTSITPMRQTGGRARIDEFLNILRKLQPSILFVCHTRWFYENIDIIKRYPQCPPVIDALHVQEPYRVGGGFPELSACRLVNRWLDHSVVISEQLKQLLSKGYGVPTEKITVIPNAIDHSAFAIPKESRLMLRRNLGIDDNDVAIGFIGRIVHQKDPLLFAEVARRIARRRPDALFLVVGTGPMEQDVREKAHLHNIAHRFIWISHVPFGESIIPALDLLMVTSRYEGVPLVILEALAAGVPVVSTDVGAIREQLSGSVALEKRGFGVSQRLTRAAWKALNGNQEEDTPPVTVGFDIPKMVDRYLAEFFRLCP